ncbi:PREDICTED: protein KBP homolog [Dinoponera quadriceps]|uniref:KIF-binding protein n=1 Tax=Dinoponera quadriceps TaxID=609295 RepID=A0A6P3YFV9_DINQU|nr:PREDICTED: protein KBP homolog [Dinoponera quadriceps]
MKGELVESSKSFGNTMINPSEEFLEIFTSSYVFSRTPSELNKKQIRTMETKISKLFHKAINLGTTKFDDIVTLAHTYLNISRVYVSSDGKEKLYIARDSVLNCLSLLKDKELDRKSILLALNAYSLLGSIYNKQKKIEKAILIHDKAVELCLTFIRENYSNPADLKDFVNMSPTKLPHELQNTYIFILQSLIDLHACMGPKNNHYLITCSHMLLVAEFDTLSESEKALSWIRTAITLCNYFLMYNRFREARNHLSAAVFVKKVFIDKACKNVIRLSSEAYDLNEQNSIAFTLIATFRAKYGITLLRRSAERLLRLEKDEDSATDSVKSEFARNSKKQVSQKLLLFPKVEEEQSDSNMYLPITAEYISSYSDAKEIFAMVLKLLHDRRLYFSADKDMKTYMTVIHDICNAYKYMAFYEQDAYGRITLQNRRIEILSNAVRNVRRTDRNMLKHLRLQLAIVYSTLVDINIENIPFKAAPLYMRRRYDTINANIDELLAKGLMNLQKYMQCE